MCNASGSGPNIMELTTGAHVFQKAFGENNFITKGANTFAMSLDPAGLFGRTKNTWFGDDEQGKLDVLGSGQRPKIESEKSWEKFYQAEERNNRLRAMAEDNPRTILGG